MRRWFAAAVVLIFGAFVFTACRKPAVDVPANDPAGSNSGSPSAPAKGTSPIGTWYEQRESGGILEVNKNKIKYTPASGTYVDEAPLKIRQSGKSYLLETNEEDYFFFVDISYDPKEDLITAYTMPVLDGDGGYKQRTFARTPYEAPPPPVYDPPADHSDPDAKKDFADMTIRSLHASFYDVGAYHDPSTNMAPMEPYADEYSYDLTVQDDGSALVSSSFCREIDLPKETVDELQQLINDADLGQINGIDIHTEGMPYDTPAYELTLELASGETIRSSANGPDVPEIWQNFQKPLHYLLYFAFRNAGYSGYDFHSTKPMKRLGTGKAAKGFDWRKMLEASEDGYYYGEYEEEDDPEGKDAQPKLTVSYDSVLVEPDWKKSYDYSLDTKYLVFKGTDPENPALMNTLQQLNAEYKTRSEEALKEDYEMMEAVPSSVWKKADRLYCYSFFVVEHDTDHGPFHSFFVSEGHANSLGAGKYGYGYYPHIKYNIDVNTGKILSVADIFTDRDTAYSLILNSMRDQWGTHNDAGKFIHSDAFAEKLDEFLDKTGPDSISWTATYHYVELYFPTAMFTMCDSPVRHLLYYDELQEALNDTYCTVW